jgi:hypothetical protein
MKLIAISECASGAAWRRKNKKLGLLDFSFTEWDSAESALELQGRMRIRRGERTVGRRANRGQIAPICGLR